MTSSTSSLKADCTAVKKTDRALLNIYRQTLRDQLSLMILLAALLAFVQPIALFLFDYNYPTAVSQVELADQLTYRYQVAVTLRETLGTGISCLFLIILATRIFGYMNNRNQVDLWHSFPVTRSGLFCAKLAGLWTAFLLPVILNTCLALPLLVRLPHSFLVKTAAENSLSPHLGDLMTNYARTYLSGQLSWLAGLIGFAGILLIFFVSFGSTFDGLASSLVLLAVLPAMFFMSAITVSETWQHLDLDSILTSRIFRTLILAVSPLLTPRAILPAFFVGIQTKNLSVGFIGGPFYWLIVGLLLTVGAGLVYKKRPSELAETTSTSSPFYKVLRSLISLAGAGFFGLIFLYTSQGRLSIIGFSLGAIITHCIIEMIVGRGVRTLGSSLKGGLVTLLILAVLLGLLAFDPARINQTRKVNPESKAVLLKTTGLYYTWRTPLLLDPSADAEIVASLNEALDRYAATEKARPYAIGGGRSTFNDGPEFSLNLSYVSADGHIARRTYPVENDQVAKISQLLLRQNKLALIVNPLFGLDPAKADQLTVFAQTTDSGYPDLPLKLTEPQKKELLKLYRADFDRLVAKSDLADDYGANRSEDYSSYRIILPAKVIREQAEGLLPTLTRAESLGLSPAAQIELGIVDPAPDEDSGISIEDRTTAYEETEADFYIDSINYPQVCQFLDNLSH